MTRSRVLVVDDSPSILRVVESVLAGAGYDVRTAADGTSGLEAMREDVPDLLLLDFMMPRMNGYQVCRTMREDQQLKTVPVVLMCTKGDGAAERFVRQMGVVDYITKPFSPDAILALTSYTLEKRPSGARTSTDVPTRKRTADAETDAPTLINKLPMFAAPAAETTALSPPPGTEEPPAEVTQNTKLDEWRRVLIRTVTQRVRDGKGDELYDIVALGVDDALAQMPPLTTAPWYEQGRPALWGDFSLVPIPEVFQLINLQGQSGLFQVWTDSELPLGGGMRNARFDVHLGKGRVDSVHAVNMQEEFLLGRFLVARGAIDKAELDGLLRARKGRGGKLLGQQLVALGHVTREQLGEALKDQARELIYELLRFQRGTFCLRKGTPPPGDNAESRLGIPVEELLLEGLRRVDEWGLIEKHIPHFDMRFETERRDQARLTEEERYVLGLTAPDLTVRVLVSRSGMRPFDVCKILYRLVVAKQLRAVG